MKKTTISKRNTWSKFNQIKDHFWNMCYHQVWSIKSVQHLHVSSSRYQLKNASGVKHESHLHLQQLHPPWTPTETDWSSPKNNFLLSNMRQCCFLHLAPFVPAFFLFLIFCYFHPLLVFIKIFFYLTVFH